MEEDDEIGALSNGIWSLKEEEAGQNDGNFLVKERRRCWSVRWTLVRHTRSQSSTEWSI